MFKKKRRILNFILLVALFVTGCDRAQKQPSTENVIPREENVIEIYYPDGFSLAATADGYQLTQPDNLTACVEEVMTQMIAVHKDFLVYYVYMLDEENNLSLELRLADGYTAEDLVLFKASLAKTLFQLSEIPSIHMMLENEAGELFRDEVVNRDSFYFYEY